MEIAVKTLNAADVTEILSIAESHFVDLKAIEIQPAKLTKTVSAFANTSGGEIYVGISEFEGESGIDRSWNGFASLEAANPIFQVLENLNPLNNGYGAEFISAVEQNGFVLHLTIFKTQDIVLASDGKAYVRRNAQSLPVIGEGPLERLRYDKGVKSFEDELISVDHREISNSSAIIDFFDAIYSGR